MKMSGPTPTAAAPAANQRRSVAASEGHPVGTRRDHGMGRRTDSSQAGPSIAAWGKSLISSQPSACASDTSVGVKQPGRYGTARRLQIEATSGDSVGATMKSLSAAMKRAAVGPSRIVPAPSMTSGRAVATWADRARKTSYAPGPRLVYSTTRAPASAHASTTAMAVAASAALKMGRTRCSRAADSTSRRLCRATRFLLMTARTKVRLGASLAERQHSPR